MSSFLVAEGSKDSYMGLLGDRFHQSFTGVSLSEEYGTWSKPSLQPMLDLETLQARHHSKNDLLLQSVAICFLRVNYNNLDKY